MCCINVSPEGLESSFFVLQNFHRLMRWGFDKMDGAPPHPEFLRLYLWVPEKKEIWAHKIRPELCGLGAEWDSPCCFKLSSFGKLRPQPGHPHVNEVHELETLSEGCAMIFCCCNGSGLKSCCSRPLCMCMNFWVADLDKISRQWYR